MHSGGPHSLLTLDQHFSSNPFCSAPRFTQTRLDRGLLDLSSCLTVEDWLDSIRLGHYRDNFAMAGYSSLGMVMHMNIE